MRLRGRRITSSENTPINWSCAAVDVNMAIYLLRPLTSGNEALQCGDGVGNNYTVDIVLSCRVMRTLLKRMYACRAKSHLHRLVLIKNLVSQ